MGNERREKIVTLTCTRIKNDMIRKWGNYNYTKYTDSNQREFSPGQDYTRLPELFWLSWIKLTLKMGQVSQLEIVARSDWGWLIFCYLLSHTVITASAVKFLYSTEDLSIWDHHKTFITRDISTSCNTA